MTDFKNAKGYIDPFTGDFMPFDPDKWKRVVEDVQKTQDAKKDAWDKKKKAVFFDQQSLASGKLVHTVHDEIEYIQPPDFSMLEAKVLANLSKEEFEKAMKVSGIEPSEAVEVWKLIEDFQKDKAMLDQIKSQHPKVSLSPTAENSIDKLSKKLGISGYPKKSSVIELGGGLYYDELADTVYKKNDKHQLVPADGFSVIRSSFGQYTLVKEVKTPGHKVQVDKPQETEKEFVEPVLGRKLDLD